MTRVGPDGSPRSGIARCLPRGGLSGHEGAMSPAARRPGPLFMLRSAHPAHRLRGHPAHTPEGLPHVGLPSRRRRHASVRRVLRGDGSADSRHARCPRLRHGHGAVHLRHAGVRGDVRGEAGPAALGELAVAAAPGHCRKHLGHHVLPRHPDHRAGAGDGAALHLRHLGGGVRGADPG